MSKKEALIQSARQVMADYTRYKERLEKNLPTDAFPVLAFTLNKDKKSFSVSRQQGDFAICERIEVPACHEGLPVTHLEGSAFMFNRVKEILLPPTIVSIDMGTESNAFRLCHHLQAIHVHPENEHYSSVNGVLFNKEQTTLLKCPEDYPGPVYTIPQGVTSIGAEAFSDCRNFTEIVIPDSVMEMGMAAFIRAAIKRVVIPGSLKLINAWAFYHCRHLSDVTISHGVQWLENYSLSGCGALAQLTLPASVEKITGRVFVDSRNLTDIYVTGHAKRPAGWSKDWNLIDAGQRAKGHWDK